MRSLHFLLAGMLWLATTAPPLLAYGTGITGYSGKNTATCNSCHSGGQVPTVMLAGPTTLDRGTETFTLTIKSNETVQQGWAGFNIAASGGTLLVVDRDTQQKLGSELTHKHVIENDGNDSVVVTFEWRAPTQDGLYTLYAAGNSVNDNRSSNGDRAATTTFAVAVGVSAPTATALVTSTPTATALPPTATPSATASPTTVASPTSPPTASATPTATASARPSDTVTATATSIPTSTATVAASATATAPPTSTLTVTQSATPTITPSAVPSATDTASPTAPSTLTPTSTVTPEPTNPAPETSPTPTPSPTASVDTLPGDANCDARVSAADVPALLMLVATGDDSQCGADVDANGVLDAADVDALPSRLFESADR